MYFVTFDPFAATGLARDPHLLTTVVVVTSPVARDSEVDKVVVAFSEPPESCLDLGSLRLVQIAQPDPVDLHDASGAGHPSIGRSP
ncbi:MAG: hypothetical protein ABFS46_23320 [Myxococcota bacterium]